jgi:hypothetical protein
VLLVAVSGRIPASGSRTLWGIKNTNRRVERAAWHGFRRLDFCDR